MEARIAIDGPDNMHRPKPQDLTPLGVTAFDSAGNLWVADTGNSALRRISSSGRVTTISLTTGSSGSTGGTGGTTPTPAPTTPSSSGGGGGGGAPTPLAVLALALLLATRAYQQRGSVN